MTTYLFYMRVYTTKMSKRYNKSYFQKNINIKEQKINWEIN